MFKLFVTNFRARSQRSMKRAIMHFCDQFWNNHFKCCRREPTYLILASKIVRPSSIYQVTCNILLQGVVSREGYFPILTEYSTT
jgi:hypothetical protein